MATKTVSAFKFVGTVSLGLMTGASYTLSNFTLPALLELPSAGSAAKALRAVRRTAAAHLDVLTAVAGTALATAFALSPRGYRHPYLLYTAALAAGARLADYLAPALLGSPDAAPSPAAQLKTAAARARRANSKRRGDDARRMEASYEVLPGRDDHSDGGPASGDDLVDDDDDDVGVNGEDVRAAIAAFTKAHVAQTAISAVGFMMAVVGIWGDGVDKIVSSEAVLVQI